MKRIDKDLIARQGEILSKPQRDEMAIPSYLHPNPILREMAWWRLRKLIGQYTLWSRDRSSCRVLDFGCGTGILFPELAALGSEVVGVDIVTKPAEICADFYGLSTNIYTPDEFFPQAQAQSFDAIIAAQVLEHIEDVSVTLREFHRILGVDGRLFVSLPTENTLYRLGRRLAGFSGDYHHSNAESVVADIQRNGFQLESNSKIPAGGSLSIYWILEFSRNALRED